MRKSIRLPSIERRWTFRLVFGAAFIFGLLVAGAGSAQALTGEESCFWSKINAERSARGVPTLTINSELISVARRHSQRMAGSGSIYHNSNLKNEVSPGWKYLGENVGVGPSCDSIHTAFMNSASHKANILDPDYNQGGVGTVISEGRIYITEIFMQKTIATQTTTTTKTTTTTTTKPRTTTTSTKPAPRPVVAEAPPPPPPPPPGSKVTGVSRNYLETMEKERIPSADEQVAYDQFLAEEAKRIAEEKRLEATEAKRQRNFFSKVAAFIAGVLSATF